MQYGLLNTPLVKKSTLWKAKLTETQIFRELSIEIESSLIQLKSSLIQHTQLESSLIELLSSVIKLESSLFEIESSIIKIESSLIQLQRSIIKNLSYLSSNELESSLIQLEIDSYIKRWDRGSNVQKPI